VQWDAVSLDKPQGSVGIDDVGADLNAAQDQVVPDLVECLLELEQLVDDGLHDRRDGDPLHCHQLPEPLPWRLRQQNQR